MFRLAKKVSRDIVESIKKGEILVLPTDTIYGIVCSALNKQSVERLYDVRKRNPNKPMIVLISSIKDLGIFNIKHKIPYKKWPRKTSIIFDVKSSDYEYLHRNKNSLAFRVPDNPSLVRLLKVTGPLVAPSANIEGRKPSETVEEAEGYFKDAVSMYIDVGRLKSKPSKIVYIKNGSIEVVRK